MIAGECTFAFESHHSLTPHESRPNQNPCPNPICCDLIEEVTHATVHICMFNLQIGQIGRITPDHNWLSVPPNIIN